MALSSSKHPGPSVSRTSATYRLATDATGCRDGLRANSCMERLSLHAVPQTAGLRATTTARRSSDLRIHVRTVQ